MILLQLNENEASELHREYTNAEINAANITENNSIQVSITYLVSEAPLLSYFCSDTSLDCIWSEMVEQNWSSTVKDVR